MSEVTEFNLHGAKVSIDTDILVNSWLEHSYQKSHAARYFFPSVFAPEIRVPKPPCIGQYWKEQGGIYAGVMRGEEGENDYYLIHASKDHEITGANWEKACEQARSSIDDFRDWSLPNRREARLLFINSPDTFNRDDWYWTSTQHAANADCAWIQGFDNGFQDYYRKTADGRGRAVRRVLVIQ